MKTKHNQHADIIAEFNRLYKEGYTSKSEIYRQIAPNYGLKPSSIAVILHRRKEAGL